MPTHRRREHTPSSGGSHTSSRGKHTTRHPRTITPQHKPIRLQQRRPKIHPHPRNVEPRPERRRIGEIGRDREVRRLRVEQDEVGVADVRGCEVGYLGRGGVCAGDAGGGGEGDVLLEPEEGGRDGGAEVGGGVDGDGDVGAVEVERGDEGWGGRKDCGRWGLVVWVGLLYEWMMMVLTVVGEGFSGDHVNAAVFHAEGGVR